MRISLKSVLDVTIWAGLAGWIVLEVFAAMFGPTSYRALREKHAEAAVLRAETDELQTRLEALSRRADRLHSNHLDAELLDERVRAVLGFAAPDEVVVPMDQFDAALIAVGAEPAPQ